jgi:hypothetical protein
VETPRDYGVPASPTPRPPCRFSAPPPRRDAWAPRMGTAAIEGTRAPVGRAVRVDAYRPAASTRPAWHSFGGLSRPSSSLRVTDVARGRPAEGARSTPRLLQSDQRELPALRVAIAPNADRRDRSATHREATASMNRSRGPCGNRALPNSPASGKNAVFLALRNSQAQLQSVLARLRCGVAVCAPVPVV